MRAWSIVLAFTGCGDNLRPEPDEPRSGARLRLVTHLFEDGAVELEARWFHDAARGERCTPRRWSDGVTTCTPAAAEAVYLDASCTALVARVPAGEPAPPPYALRMYWLDGAWHPSRLFARGERVDAPLEVFVLRDGLCQLGELGAHDYYAIGAEMDRTALVRVTTPEVERTPALALSAYTSADGLHAPVALRDLELDAACALEAAPGADTAICAPLAAEPLTAYADDACASPVLTHSPRTTLPARLRHVNPVSGCVSYHVVAAELPPLTRLYHRADRRCETLTVPAFLRFYRASEPVPTPSLVRERVPAGARLDALVARDGDLHVRGSAFYDTQLATECRRALVDGVARCVPVTATAVTTLFADDACTTPLPLALVEDGACRAPLPFAHDASGGIRAIGAVHTAAIYHPSTGDRCLPYLPPAGLTPHAVGDVLPAEAFVAADETHD